MSHPDELFLRRYLAPLVGGTITYVSVEPNDEDYANAPPYPVIHVRAKDGKTTYKLEIAQDEEGNGPGFVFGLPFPGEESS